MRRSSSVLHLPGFLLLCCAVCACHSARSASSNAVAREASPTGKTIGFVLANFDALFYRATGDKAECPEGSLHSNRENWEAQFPTRAARQAHLNRCGGFQERGPNCENVWFTPEVIEDPLPFREVKGKIAYGINLDGTQDGKETKNTCAHEKFISPDGEPGIDNQYYRFFGCEKFRQLEEDNKSYVQTNLVYRVLLEINGLQNERGDNAVEVALYRGRDPLSLDASGKAVPWQSHRIEEGPRQLIARLHGRIEGGVLTTEAADVVWEGAVWERGLFIRGMTLRLKLTPTKAEGLRVGYIDVEQLWQSYSRAAAAVGSLSAGSGPSAFVALHRLADGYRNPETGACTALSSALKLEFIRAYVIHPSREMNP